MTPTTAKARTVTEIAYSWHNPETTLGRQYIAVYIFQVKTTEQKNMEETYPLN